MAAAQAEVDERVAKLTATAMASPHLTPLRQRADRLAKDLADTRDELGNTTSRHDQLAGSVRGVMLAGGDWKQSERDRDAAASEMTRLAGRVENLAAAHQTAVGDLSEAEAKAVRVACRRHLLIAEASEKDAERMIEELRERYRVELANAETARDASRVVADRLFRSASPDGYRTMALNGGPGRYDPHSDELAESDSEPAAGAESTAETPTGRKRSAK